MVNQQSQDSGILTMDYGILQTHTNNAGDSIQNHASALLLKSLGHVPTITVERDFGLAATTSPVRILLNGWFKHGKGYWPPGRCIEPIFSGFHMSWNRALVSRRALRYYRQHQPIGVRDIHTAATLTRHGIEAVVTNCTTLTLGEHYRPASARTEVVVISRDDQILQFLPEQIRSGTFIRHYTNRPEQASRHALRTFHYYRTHARVVVTTLLHIALPALGLGLPVVMLRPLETGQQREADEHRFSTLATMIPIHDPKHSLEPQDWGG